MTLKQSFAAFLIGGLLFSLTSCITFKSPTKSSSTVKKKRHPHGGPPGQTKKQHNKSRKHLEPFYLIDVTIDK